MICGYCKTPDTTTSHVRACADVRWGHTPASVAPHVTIPAPRSQAVVPFKQQVADAIAATPLSPAFRAAEAERTARRREAAARLVGGSLLTHAPAVTAPADPAQAAPEVANRARTTAQRLGVNPKTVPGSKYALPAADGSGAVEFYKVEVPTQGKWAGFRFVVRLHENAGQGPRWSKQPLVKAEQVAVLARIAASTYVDALPSEGTARRLTGPEAAAVRFARHTGRCAVCETPHRPASIATGLDPACAGRFTGVYAA